MEASWYIVQQILISGKVIRIAEAHSRHKLVLFFLYNNRDNNEQLLILHVSSGCLAIPVAG